MKIEKINDNQIKCTLNKSDLTSRRLEVGELAYGTERTKLLFREMMQLASLEFGFEAENMPLMIEAIPIPDESIILIITKVDDPEELDTRFSNFSPDSLCYEPEEEYDLQEEVDFSDYYDDMEVIEGPEETCEPSLIDLYQELMRKLKRAEYTETKEQPATETTPDEAPLFGIFSFDSLEDVLALAHLLDRQYHGENSLYKSDRNNRYYLILYKSSHTMAEYSRIYETVCEYGFAEPASRVSEAYYTEHFRKIIERDALKHLNSIYQEDNYNGTDF